MDNNFAEIDRIIAQFKLQSRALEHGVPQQNELELDALIRKISHHCGIDDTIRFESEAVAMMPRLQLEFLPPSREYRLQDLLSFDEERFIDNSFRAILQREPDKDGRDYYLRKLRTGEMSKIGILSELRWSPEGLRAGIHVDGLLIRRYLDQLDRIAMVGPIFRWLKGFLKLHTLASTYQLARSGQALGFRAIDESNAQADEIRALILRESREASDSLGMAVQRLEAMNGALVQEGMEARTQWSELSSVSHRQGQLLHELQEDIAVRAASHTRELAAIQVEHRRVLEAMGSAHATVQSRHEEALRELRAQHATIAKELKDMEASFRASLSTFDARFEEVEGVGEALASMSKELGHRLTSASSDFERRLSAMSRDLGQIGADALPFFQAQAERKAEAGLRREKLTPLYSRFENRFRGSEEEISQRMSSYLDVISGTIAGGFEAPVLDLGSGRGEWLHLLRHQGLHARGVDLNPEFVRRCNSQGLSVAEMDVLEALRSTETSSIGAVTSMHLIEHLPFDRVIELLDESLRILKPGGLLILETPNPENIEVASHWFYMDPTHRNPIPPTLLQWVLEDRGFQNVSIRRESEFRHFSPPELMDESDKGAEQVNRMLAGYLAAPDYAVVGERP